jgi:hypothetical protein
MRLAIAAIAAFVLVGVVRANDHVWRLWCSDAATPDEFFATKSLHDTSRECNDDENAVMQDVRTNCVDTKNGPQFRQTDGTWKGDRPSSKTCRDVLAYYERCECRPERVPSHPTP